MNAYEFIVKMKDYASSGLRKVAQSAGVTDSRVKGVDNSMKNANKTTGVWGNSLSKFKKLLVGTFSVVALTMFTNKVLDARAEYEKFDAVLANTFQSADVGRGALNMLTDFAKKTPFQLNELSGSFVKLVNRGINPTQDELRKMGDLAASQGKGFDQLTEAILDAGTNEFERLKEFGIKASKSGNKVTLMFKGQKKVVDANSESIKNAILQYGGMEGVAGSMESISKTLGGRISNLKDQWWNFLVAVGGQSGGIFSRVIDLLSTGLSFLTDQLPVISKWFEILWSMIEPVGVALWNFIQSAFGFQSAGNVMQTFGNIMMGVLMVVDFFTTGLMTIIDWLSPFADGILVATGAWAAFNAVVAISPIGWIIIGIVTLISLIGMVSKYTSGWGDAWQHTVNGAKYLWQGFTGHAEAMFITFVNGIMIGINKIKQGWYEFKNAVGLGDETENNAVIQQIKQDTENRKKAIVDAHKKSIEAFANAAGEFSQVKINVDTEGFKKDFNGLKNKFKNLGETNTGTGAYDNYLKKKNAENDGTNKKGNGTATPGQSIVSGGSKKTNINITIQKLQDDTKIFVDSTEKGVDKLGEKVQEILLRAINSVNQIQTN